VSSEFSVGWSITEKERAAITTIPKAVWADAIDADGGHRDGASLAEITRVLPACALAAYPSGTRVIVRRERPHPGAQLDAFEEADGWRYPAFATDTRVGQLAHLDARHRTHARVEDRIRCAKDTGLDHFPSRSFAINAAWLSVVMVAVDLLAWTQHLLLHGDLAKAEPKTLRYSASAGSGCVSNAPGPGLATSLRRSPGSQHCPSRLVDLRARHDERRGYRQNQHAGGTNTSNFSRGTRQGDNAITRSIRGFHE
jgi:hypothetical protein